MICNTKSVVGLFCQQIGKKYALEQSLKKWKTIALCREIFFTDLFTLHATGVAIITSCVGAFIY